jgi:hypothetical protein
MKKLLAVLVLVVSVMASQAAFAQDTTSVKHKAHHTMKKAESKAKKTEKKASKKMKHSASKDSTMENTK